MPKRLAVALMAVLAALAIVLPVSSAQAGTANVGTSTCYVWIDYWEVDVHVQSYYPFVVVTGPTGNIGGGVSCPIPPIPPIKDWISWT